MIDPRVLIADPSFKAHWREEMTEDEYHADKTAVGSSSLRKVLASPRAFYWDFFKGIKEEESDALRIGRMVHKAILEGDDFKKCYVVMPEFTGYTKDGKLSTRSKEAQEKKARWKAELPPGKLSVSQEELEMITGQIESILSHDQGALTIKDGKPEMAGYYRDPETGILLKIKPDFLGFDCVKLTDLKTAANNSKLQFGNAAFDHRYDIQLYQYCVGVFHITGKWPEVITNLTVEKKPPYECAIYYYDPADLEQAKLDYHRALRKLRKCIDTNFWPQRQTTMERVHTPLWFINRSVEEEQT